MAGNERHGWGSPTYPLAHHECLQIKQDRDSDTENMNKPHHESLQVKQEDSDNENCNIDSLIGDIKNAHEALSIKQNEGYGADNSNLDSITGELARYNTGSTEKKDPVLSSDGVPSNPFRGESTSPADKSYWKQTLAQDFAYIRTCLSRVLGTDSISRHELVQAIKFKLKQIEATTTAEKTTRALNIKPELLVDERSAVPSGSTGRPFKSDESLIKSEFDEVTFTGNKCMESGNECSIGSHESFNPNVGLITKIGDGVVKCNVCGRVITSKRQSCNPCASYVSRIRTKYREGGMLPPCSHKNFSGVTWCKSCRFNKYIKLSKGEVLAYRRWWSYKIPPKERRPNKKPPQQGRARKCKICEKKSYWFRAWRCSACHGFQMRLKAMHAAGQRLPECEHDGYYAGMGCKGCRRIRLQKELELRVPEQASQWPTIPQCSV